VLPLFVFPKVSPYKFNLARFTQVYSHPKGRKDIVVAKFSCNSSSCLIFLRGCPATVLIFTPRGFVISRGHLISWLRFLIRSGLCDSPDPGSSSCQDSGSSFSILSSKCQLPTAAPVTRSSILSSPAGAWAVDPIALADVSKTPYPELYNSYKESRHIIETLYLIAVVDPTRGNFLKGLSYFKS